MNKSHIKKLKPRCGFDWEGFKKYVNGYDPIVHGGDRMQTIQEDMIYGVGRFSDVGKFSMAEGYARFKRLLLVRWERPLLSTPQSSTPEPELTSPAADAGRSGLAATK